MGKVVLALSIVCLAVAGVAAQVGDKVDVPPFAVGNGTSFSASRAPVTPKVKRPVPTSDLVTDFTAALDLIRRNHVNGSRTHTQQLTKSAITGMLAELDPHSEYFDPQEFSSLLGDHRSEYSGTGSSISNFLRAGVLETYILSTQAGSPASRAGLHFGDRIIAVDGHPVVGLSAEAVRDKVRGPQGTKVRLTIERAATGKVETISLARDRVSQPSVANAFMIQNTTGYIGLTEGFGNATATELKEALVDLRRQGATQLILDLRGNTGGILEQAVRVAETFLPAGRTIISQRGRYAFDQRRWSSRNRDPETLAIVVLVDGQTASAAEIVAGALQDNNRALVVGQTTFGKGLVQNVIELPLGSGLTLTSARYYTPSGKSIQRSYTGIGRYAYFASTRAPEPTQTARGIVPDQATPAEGYDDEKSRLIDPIFFFARTAFTGTVTQAETGRNAVCDGKGDAGEFVRGFENYVARAGWKVSAETLAKNRDFINDQIRFQIALGCGGTHGAGKARIRREKDVAVALAAMPRAKMLADRIVPAVETVNVKKPAKSHPRRVKVETGGIRKTVRSRTK